MEAKDRISRQAIGKHAFPMKPKPDTTKGTTDSPKKGLTPRQRNALQLILDGYTPKEVQERLGISPRTLLNWRNLPAWDEEISLVLRGSSDDGEGQVKSMLPLATRRLKLLIHSVSENVALGACRTVLEAHASIVARQEEREAMQAMEAQLVELQNKISQQNQLALEPAIEAEIHVISQDSSQPEQVEAEEAQ